MPRHVTDRGFVLLAMLTADDADTTDHTDISERCAFSRTNRGLVLLASLTADEADNADHTDICKNLRHLCHLRLIPSTPKTRRRSLPVLTRVSGKILFTIPYSLPAPEQTRPADHSRVQNKISRPGSRRCPACFRRASGWSVRRFASRDRDRNALADR